MSLAAEPESRRGLILLAAAWLLVLGLVAAAAVFVLLERHVTAQREAGLVLALPAEPEPDLTAEPSPAPAEVTVEALPERPRPVEPADLPASDPTENPAEPAPAVASVAPAPQAEATPEREPPAAATERGAERAAEPAPPAARAAPEEVDRAGEESVGAAADAVDGVTAPAPETPAPETPAAETPAAQTEVARLDLPAWRRYSNARDAAGERPRIAVVITGLGQSAAATEAAIKRLPPGVTLSFTPYARQLNQWIALARVNKHEIMLDLPMEPVTFPEDDPGPHALLTVLDTPENLRRLDWLLNRGNSYVGVTAVMGSRFTASEVHVQPILAALKERGLLYLDNAPSPDSVADSLARQMNLPHAVIDRTLDSEQASRLAINARLNEVERLALEQGFAVAIGQPYPVTIERVGEWGNALASRGFDLVPITALANAERQRPAVAVEQ